PPLRPPSLPDALPIFEELAELGCEHILELLAQGLHLGADVVDGLVQPLQLAFHLVGPDVFLAYLQVVRQPHPGAPEGDPARGSLDRKSTRLNSSHVKS